MKMLNFSSLWNFWQTLLSQRKDKKNKLNAQCHSLAVFVPLHLRDYIVHSDNKVQQSSSTYLPWSSDILSVMSEIKSQVFSLSFHVKYWFIFELPQLEFSQKIMQIRPLWIKGDKGRASFCNKFVLIC